MEQSPREPEEEEGAETATLPRSILMGKDFKVGDEVVLRITHMGEDEIAVEYAPEPAGGGEEEEAGAPAENPNTYMD